MMYIGDVTIRDYVNCIKDGVITKEKLLDFIIERENCSIEDAEEIQVEVLESLED